MRFRALLGRYWSGERLRDWEGGRTTLTVIIRSYIEGCDFQGFCSNRAGSRLK